MYYYAEPHAPIDHGSMARIMAAVAFQGRSHALRHHRRIHSRTQHDLFGIVSLYM